MLGVHEQLQLEFKSSFSTTFSMLLTVCYQAPLEKESVQDPRI